MSLGVEYKFLTHAKNQMLRKVVSCKMEKQKDGQKTQVLKFCTGFRKECQKETGSKSVRKDGKRKTVLYGFALQNITKYLLHNKRLKNEGLSDKI